MKKPITSILFAISALIVTTTANALIINDRAIFESYLGAKVIDDYENPNYQYLQSDAAMTSVLGETRYTATAHPNYNFVSTHNIGGGAVYTHYYCAGCNGSFLLTFTNTSVGDSNGVYGVGFDFFNSEAFPYHAFITYGDGSTYDFQLGSFDYFSNWGFFGVVSDTRISSINFGSVGGGITGAGSFGIDNLTIGNAVESPEPTGIVLLFVGLTGLALSRRLTG